LETVVLFSPAETNRSSHVGISGVGYAKAAYERLPRELWDLVYEHLWSTIDIPTKNDSSSTIVACANEDLDSAITRVRQVGFSAPTIVGKLFAREAFHWLYEHGILGYKVQLNYLGSCLFTGKYSVGLVPVDCRPRSINVAIECPIPPHMPCPTEDEITGNFTPLLQLQLIDGFQLTIHIVVRYFDWLHCHNLLAINERVQDVAKAFSEKKAEVKVEYEIKYDNLAHNRACYLTPRRTWHMGGELTQYKQGLWVSAPTIYFRGLVPRSSKKIQGQDAEVLLGADADAWVTYLNKLFPTL
jgi:hypothetical protein